MFVEQVRRAIMAAPRTGLDALAKAVWSAFGSDVLSDVEAGELCELIAARRAVPSPQAAPPRRVGSRPRSSASLERRRAWTASGWMPPAIASRFTMGEAAALAVIIREIATTGRCALPVGAIAGRAGVCATIVKRAVREARRLGLVAVEERRVSYSRSLPNLISIASKELRLWARTRARIERQAPGGTSVPTTTNHIFSPPMRHADTLTKGVSRGRNSAWNPHRNGPSPQHQPSPISKGRA